MMRIIGVCGFGYSGSGAILDILKSYVEVEVLDKVEFSIVYTPDGVEDLYRNICISPSRYWTSDSAIRRFKVLAKRRRKLYNKLTYGKYDGIVRKFMSNIVQVIWKGSTSVHIYQDSTFNYFIYQRIFRRLILLYEHYFGRLPFHIKPLKEMYFSAVKSENFVKYAHVFIMELINSMRKELRDIVVLDQPFSANNPEKSFAFFDNPKAIVVVRDPRDMYILAKRNLGIRGSFIPTEKVEDFICYYRGLMNSSCHNSKDVLNVCFEDLIYSTKTVLNNIEKFVGCSNKKNIEPKFDPDVSINNTQLWLKYPEYMLDIDIIEKELSTYLYDFSNYTKKPSFNKDSF